MDKPCTNLSTSCVELIYRSAYTLTRKLPGTFELSIVELSPHQQATAATAPYKSAKVVINSSRSFRILSRKATSLFHTSTKLNSWQTHKAEHSRVNGH